MAKVTRTLNERQKAFIDEIEAMSQSYAMHDKFRDAVRCMAIALHVPVIVDKAEHDASEAEYKTYLEKYGSSGMTHMAQALAIVTDALESKREDFLGNVLEGIGSANVHSGQFLTPTHVARMMARVSAHPDANHEPGQIVSINDPSCGASVTLIEGAEEMMQGHHVPQRDIMLYAEDLDYNAFNISYVQLALLGYAARVTRMDSLARTVYEGPWFTPGYFFHAMPMRLHRRAQECGDVDSAPTEELDSTKFDVAAAGQNTVAPATDNVPIQGELGFD